MGYLGYGPRSTIDLFLVLYSQKAFDLSCCSEDNSSTATVQCLWYIRLLPCYNDNSCCPCTLTVEPMSATMTYECAVYFCETSLVLLAEVGYMSYVNVHKICPNEPK